jgi:sugar lactone lactonase YvrE
LVYNPDSDKVRPLPVPLDGWYGPRSVGVASDGTIAAADTGHQRIVLISAAAGAPQVETIGGNGSGPGELVEPVGITWLDDERILVCDTGNRRLQILDRRGQALEVVNLPEAWSDFYSRPQVVELSDNRWLVTDVSARSLWLVEDGTAREIDLGEAGIIPTGLARDGDTLYLADLNSRVWVLDLPTTD